MKLGAGNIDLDVTKQVDWRKIMKALEESQNFGDDELERIALAAMGKRTSRKDADSESAQKQNIPTIDETVRDPTEPASVEDRKVTEMAGSGGEQYYKIDGLNHRFVDVAADGNCLFHALALIPAVRFDSGEEIRQAVVSYVLNGKARNCGQLNQIEKRLCKMLPRGSITWMWHPGPEQCQNMVSGEHHGKLPSSPSCVESKLLFWLHLHLALVESP
jgi:hypothetical protein